MLQPRENIEFSCNRSISKNRNESENNVNKPTQVFRCRRRVV